ncbi:MAG: hypothetical protein OXS28_18230 [Gammaproteobacteria bacterium]|nr:hypothetical protein [Gammaproteobacteria bacterium]MDE0286396.1 hypothetical protein [Gammaproteobacteria bacterium]
MADGFRDGAAQHVHAGNGHNALLRRLVEGEDKTEDIASVDERDKENISRIGNFIVENDLAESRLYELRLISIVSRI